MNKAIKNTWIIIVCMFSMLFFSVSLIQVVLAPKLYKNQWNYRSLYKEFDNYRGSILVNGTPIAYSVPVENEKNIFKFQRKYIQPEIYAGLTGFYSFYFGSSGLESVINDELTGKSNIFLKDKLKRFLNGNYKNGYSVELTIDPKIQKLTYDILGNYTGSIVVLNPKTGNIIAMVSKPSYNTNLMAVHNPNEAKANFFQLKKESLKPLYTNSAIGNLYAPGSVFKLIDTAAALNSGKYKSNSLLPNPLSLKLPGSTSSLPNYVHGGCNFKNKVDFSFALEQSCNTPFASIAIKLGQKSIAEQAKKFGFGENSLSIPLPVIPSVFPENLDQAQLALSSIGQYDVKATPLQIAMISSAIANRGIQMKPNLIKSIYSPEYKKIFEKKPEKLRTSISPEIAKYITEWMTMTVSKGIAKDAQIKGISVAGKTGTAEINVDNNAWFTGFAPAEDPEVAISIVVNGVDMSTGNKLTTPNAKKIFEAVLYNEV